jgi:hypothetical protein
LGKAPFPRRCCRRSAAMGKVLGKVSWPSCGYDRRSLGASFSVLRTIFDYGT